MSTTKWLLPPPLNRVRIAGSQKLVMFTPLLTPSVHATAVMSLPRPYENCCSAMSYSLFVDLLAI